MVVPTNVVLVAVYLRRSREEQDGSIERQRSQVLPHCERKGYRVVEIYTDDDKGWHKGRPGFLKLLADARAGKFSRIVVDEPSRLSRDEPLDFLAEVAHPLRAAGVDVESLTRGVQDFKGDVNLIVAVVDQGRAAGESENLSRRVAAEFLRRADAGELFLGKAPFGMKYEFRDEVRKGKPVKARDRLVPDPATAPVALWIFEQYGRHGRSLRWLAQELKARGVLPPKGRRAYKVKDADGNLVKGPDGRPVEAPKSDRWEPSTVRKILRRRAYVGDYSFNELHAGKYHRLRKRDGTPEPTTKRAKAGKKHSSQKNDPADWFVIKEHSRIVPLVPRDLWERVQAKLEGNQTNTSPKGQGNDYVLSGLLVCDRCGSRLTGSLERNARTAYKRYRCQGGVKYGAGTCKNYKVTEAPLVRLLVRKLEEYFLNPDALDELRAEARRRAATTPAEMDTLRARVAALDGQIATAEGNLALASTPASFRTVETVLARLRAERD